ncbi:MAG: aminoglycoside phosphotransferase family protein [Anaerolineaceae bacterium]|nr:aminoglycoside phosphotransferase family protein [Anaerolineaceae bacterium]
MRYSIALVLFFLTALALASCAPAALPPQAAEAPVFEATPPAAQPEKPETQATQHPAGLQSSQKEEAATGEADTLSPNLAEPEKSSPAPAVQATALPVEPVAENRLVELEWPSQMRLGDSDIIRLALTPYKEGYLVQAEFPEHKIQSQTLVIKRLAGYTLAAAARLDGVGFEIQPTGDQPQYLLAGQALTWRWTIRPRAAGQQRLAVMVLLQWLPEPGSALQEHQTLLFSSGLDVRVSSLLGLTQAQATTGGLFSLVFGGGIGLFALIYRPRPPGAALRMLTPNPKVSLEPNPGMQLRPDETGLLKALFQHYARVSLVSEFLSGYSGARAFLALPVRPNGRSDAYTIVKIGPKTDIRREFQNYETYVRDSLPPMTARIQRPPATVRGSERAALQYTFIAEPGRLPVSLRLALRENPDPALLFQLFNSFGPNWWMQREPYVFRLGEEYDRLLPPHVVLQPVAVAGKALPVLEPGRPPGRLSFSPGNTLLIARFPHAEKRQDGISMTLSGHPTPGQSPIRVRWLSNTPPDHSAGRVTATRATLLTEYTQGFDRLGLPDPLEYLEERLNETVTGTQSIIHGDLNLENILVGPGELVWLIDFSETRLGHPMFDFARLATEIIAHILAANIGSGKIYLNELSAGNPLLKAVEELAGKCLFNPGVRREYNLALYVSCLGALKFSNLDRRQKHLLYLTAAFLCQQF